MSPVKAAPLGAPTTTGSSLVAWRGTPGITDRPQPFDASTVDTPVPVTVVDFAPVESGKESVWLILDDTGAIGRFHAGTGRWVVLAQCTVPDEPGHEPWAGHQLRRRLHVSRDGRFAAVVNDFGHHGQVLDLHTGAVTATLHGGDYRPDTVPFSLAFTEHAGRTVVVHRTEWNRLDITEAATGRLLTSRTLAAGSRAIHPSTTSTTSTERDEPAMSQTEHACLQPRQRGTSV